MTHVPLSALYGDSSCQDTCFLTFPVPHTTGIMAHSRGKSLGIYEDKEKTDEQIEARKKRDEEMGVEKVDVFGMKVGGGLVA